MLRIRVLNQEQVQDLDHATGPLEFGRGLRREVPRVVIAHAGVSRDHLRIEELPGGRVRVENLSQRNPVQVSSGTPLMTGTSQELDLPLALGIGPVRIELRCPPAHSADMQSLRTIAPPRGFGGEPDVSFRLDVLDKDPSPEQLAQWLERVLALQRDDVGPAEFYQRIARMVVELIGLDSSLVLLRDNQHWKVAAEYAARAGEEVEYSRTLAEHVFRQRRTFYEDLDAVLSEAASLQEVSAAVVSPIFGLQDEVVGLVYGTRRRGRRQNRLRPLEAQLVQLLAASASSHLARAAAIRTRVQFEQFFSPELVRELERNPGLLEGREAEVTILVSDLRGYTAISQRLGGQASCRLVRDLMECLSQRIMDHGGVIVDYAGDGILAMWNAPAVQADHAAKACRAALAMLGELPALNVQWQPIVGTPLALGIGLNSGPAQVGNTGSSRKFKYGPHGHTVNLASRVQDATKKVGVSVLLTRATRELLPPTFTTCEMGAVPMAGVAEEVAVYALQGESPHHS
ncbi:MAG: hypothetical protein K2R98_30870 [Gemmataceae bacterium]|nr:hypothetical protein [Gemmataceae bacterium]